MLLAFVLAKCAAFDYFDNGNGQGIPETESHFEFLHSLDPLWPHDDLLGNTLSADCKSRPMPHACSESKILRPDLNT